MKNLKNQKGITLVALVVTIIVLLILAGVSLSLVAGGNGIMSKSVTAVDETNKAAAREQTELALADIVMDYYEKKYVDGNLDSSITNQLGYIASQTQPITAGNYTVNVAADGKLTVKKGEIEVATGTIGEDGKIETWTATGETNNPSTNTTNET